MFFAERDVQPDKFASIPSAMWWSVITLTTVGYGDVFPVTVAGRMIAGVIAVLGIGLFALPAGILRSGFLEELQHRRRLG
jgi:voltage-gated potassium channel